MNAADARHAGHIDHGKTALIRALTGVDTDRLPEERAAGSRSSSATRSLALPCGPAAVGGRRARPRALRAHDGGRRHRDRPVPDDDRRRRRRDAADARARRRARRRSASSAGVVAVTKSDLADPELALLEATSCSRGRGRGRLGADRRRPRRAAGRACGRVRRGRLAGRHDRRRARLHVDRVFTIRGAGTVVTGTLWSGAGRARRRARAAARGAAGSACAASRSTTSRWSGRRPDSAWR